MRLNTCWLPFIAALIATAAHAGQKACDGAPSSAKLASVQKFYADRCSNLSDFDHAAVEEPGIEKWRQLKNEFFQSRYPGLEKSLADLRARAVTLRESPQDGTYQGEVDEALGELRFAIEDVTKAAGRIQPNFGTTLSTLDDLSKGLDRLDAALGALGPARMKSFERWKAFWLSQPVEERIKMPDNIYAKYKKFAGGIGDRVPNAPSYEAMEGRAAEVQDKALAQLRAFRGEMRQILECRLTFYELRKAREEAPKVCLLSDAKSSAGAFSTSDPGENKQVDGVAIVESNEICAEPQKMVCRQPLAASTGE